MTFFALYATLTVFWTGETITPELEIGPQVSHTDYEHVDATLYPLTLTWTPEEGFGAQSSVSAAGGFAWGEGP